MAIFGGVLLSLVLYLERVSRPKIVSRAPDPRLYKHAFSSDPQLKQCPQLRILRIDGSLFFGSVNHVQQKFEKLRVESPQQKHLAIIAEGMNFVDLQGSETLVAEARQREAMGGHLYLINVKQGLWNALDKYGCLDVIGANNVFQSKTAAIRGIYQKLDKSVCATCENRIFNECRQYVQMPQTTDVAVDKQPRYAGANS